MDGTRTTNGEAGTTTDLSGLERLAFSGLLARQWEAQEAKRDSDISQDPLEVI